jgi:hypothetical protein
MLEPFDTKCPKCGGHGLARQQGMRLPTLDGPWAGWAIAIVVSVGILCVFVAACQALYSSAVANAPPPPTVTPIEVTAQALGEAYHDNEIAAQARYGGQYLIVSGIVDTVGYDIFDDPYIIVRGHGNRLDADEIRATLAEHQLGKAAGLREGDEVVIEGWCDNGVIQVHLEDAVIW